MSATARLGLSILLGCAPILGYSDALPPFRGQTIADSLLKRNVLEVISVVVKAKLQCSIIGEVRTQKVGASDLPLPLPLPEGAGPATYERWTIIACSKTQPFIVTFYYGEDGGLKFVTMTEKVSDS